MRLKVRTFSRTGARSVDVGTQVAATITATTASGSHVPDPNRQNNRATTTVQFN